MLANNAAGARSFGHGAIRDWVSELDVVWADGSRSLLGPETESPPAVHGLLDDFRGECTPPLDDWPAVRKNSSGYALDHFVPTGDPRHLIVGSEGHREQAFRKLAYQSR